MAEKKTPRPFKVTVNDASKQKVTGDPKPGEKTKGGEKANAH